jgi:hypothetical protein
MIEVVAIVLGVFCVAIFVAHAVDAYLAPLQGPVTSPSSMAPGRSVVRLPPCGVMCRPIGAGARASP